MPRLIRIIALKNDADAWALGFVLDDGSMKGCTIPHRTSIEDIIMRLRGLASILERKYPPTEGDDS